MFWVSVSQKRLWELLVSVLLELLPAPPPLPPRAMLVLAPECLASINAALKNRLQRAVNIALGSGLATLSLSVPAILISALLMGHTLMLGLDPSQMVMMLATLWVANIALATERTNLMQGTVLLVLFLTFGFLIVVP